MTQGAKENIDSMTQEDLKKHKMQKKYKIEDTRTQEHKEIRRKIKYKYWT